MDDFQLVGSSQVGDRASFGSLIDRYYKNIYRFALHYTGNHHDADEVCQETFLRAFVSINKLRDGNCFKGWIFMIALNLLKRRIKRSKRKKMLDIKELDNVTVEAIGDKATNPSESLSAKEKTKIIHEELQKMPEQVRIATILVLMEGFAQKDAAGILNCSESSISRHLDMARNRLRATLQNLI